MNRARGKTRLWLDDLCVLSSTATAANHNAPSLGRETGLQEHERTGFDTPWTTRPRGRDAHRLFVYQVGDDAVAVKSSRARTNVHVAKRDRATGANGVAVGSLGAVRRPRRQLGGQRFVRGRVQHAHLGRRVCQLHRLRYLAAANGNKSSNRTTTSVSCSARQPCENITFVDFALAVGTCAYVAEGGVVGMSGSGCC